MPVLAHVLAEGWAKMPDEVLGNARMTSRKTGLPLKSIRQGYLLRVLSLPQKLMGSGEATVIDEYDASRLRLALDSDEVRRRLVTFSLWLTEISKIRIDRKLYVVDRERIAEAAELRFGRLEGSHLHLQALQACIEYARSSDQTANLTNKLLDDYLKDAEHLDACERLLSEVWQERPRFGTDSAGIRSLDLYHSMLLAVDTGSVESEPVTAELWRQILATEEVHLGDSAAFEYGLVRRRPANVPLVLEQPSLHRAQAQNAIADNGGVVVAEDHSGKALFPLDASVLSRLKRTRWGLAARVIVRQTPEDALRIAIEGSALPLGLPYQWARQIMLLGEVALIYIGTDTQEDPASYRATLDSATGLARKIAKKWRNRVVRAQRFGGVVRSDDANALFLDPRAYVMGRLWTRVLRLTLRSSDPPRSDEVLAEIEGVIESVSLQLPSLVAGIVRLRGHQADFDLTLDLQGGEGSENAGRRTASFSGFDHLIGAAMQEFGAHRVIRFWNDVFRIRSLDDAAPERSEWRILSRGETEGSDLGAELSFEELHVWLTTTQNPIPSPFDHVLAHAATHRGRAQVVRFWNETATLDAGGDPDELEHQWNEFVESAQDAEDVELRPQDIEFGDLRDWLRRSHIGDCEIGIGKRYRSLGDAVMFPQ